MKKRYLFVALTCSIAFAVNMYLAAFFDTWLSFGTVYRFHGLGNLINDVFNTKGKYFWMVLSLGVIVSVTYIFILQRLRNTRSDTVQVLPGLQMPKSAGNGEFGTAQWLDPREFKHHFGMVKLPTGARSNVSIPEESAGLIIGYTKNMKYAYTIKDDTHTLTIGATRSGKSRHLMMPSIGLLAFAEENMVISDVKGELFFMTSKFLRSVGYDTVALNFSSPLKSRRYNFLQPIIDYVNEDNIMMAVESTWDLVSSLVGEPKGERIWNNGECSILACGIMCVVYDNRDNYKYQNLTNVYHFLGKMCTPLPDDSLPLTAYLMEMPDSHPAKSLVDISNVAPSKTRGSFYTSALSTLRLFTNESIQYMTSATDFDFYNASCSKQAIYIILPDEKSTYYSVATLFIMMHYQSIVKSAREQGGRLNVRLNYLLDEVGNFTKIENLNTMLTMGGGRGIRFNLLIQDFKQLDDKYGRDLADVIRNNCETWIYLQTDNYNTKKEISEKLGQYTIKTFGSSSNDNNSFTSSSNLAGRSLLDASELGKIHRPYQLVTSRVNPCIMYCPDISKTIFNKLFGMGSKKHNIALTKTRMDEIPNQKPSADDLALWGIWDSYIYTQPRYSFNSIRKNINPRRS